MQDYRRAKGLCQATKSTRNSSFGLYLNGNDETSRPIVYFVCPGVPAACVQFFKDDEHLPAFCHDCNASIVRSSLINSERFFLYTPMKILLKKTMELNEENMKQFMQDVDMESPVMTDICQSQWYREIMDTCEDCEEALLLLTYNININGIDR